MSAEARVRKLEALLAKIEQKRHPRPPRPGAVAVAEPAEEISQVIARADERPTPVPSAPQPDVARGAVHKPVGLQPELTPVRSPTPMEAALRGAPAISEPEPVREPELTFSEPEITFSEPEITIGSEPELSFGSEPELLIVEDEEEPELVIDEPLMEEQPTAPIVGGGLRSPSPTPDPSAARTAPIDTRAPSVPQRAPSAAAVESAPVSVAIAPTQASSPIAKVVSRAEPKTFGELLDRTLALRPR